MKYKTLVGALSGKTFRIPDVNQAPMPAITPGGVVMNGRTLADFAVPNTPGQPDMLSFRRKFSLLVPATNTAMEHEIWSIIFNNQGPGGLGGVGIHTVNIVTPKIQLGTDADLVEFKGQFAVALDQAILQAQLAQPEYLILGMSLEHILCGLGEVGGLMADVESRYDYAFSTSYVSLDAGLRKYHAKRIGLITPFNKTGNENAKKLFEDMGYEVVATFGFSCINLVDIAHIPDSAKEEAILRYLATPENKLDAVVQLGTNMSMIQVAEKLEPRIGMPILGINAVTFWHAVRENGFAEPMVRSSRLLREF